MEMLVDFSKPVNQKQKEEAEENGLILLSRTNEANYNYYQFKTCGHFEFIQPTHVRHLRFSCKTCRQLLIKNTAEQIGYVLLGEGQVNKSTFLKPCGHIVRLSLQALSTNQNLKCEQCFTEKVEFAAKANGYRLLGKTAGDSYNIEFVNCGHNKKTKTQQILRGNVECKICVDLGYRKIAEENGLVYNGEPSIVGKGYRNYTMPCGHSKDIRISHVMNGNWQCDICNYTHRLRPSLVYLILLKS